MKVLARFGALSCCRVVFPRIISCNPSLFLNARGFASSDIFVGGLSWNVDEKTLKNLFSTYGQVTEVRIIYDRDTGRSRGFGFVKFSNENGAKDAIDAMDGKELLGRPLRINYALKKVSMQKSTVAPKLSPLDSEFDRNRTQNTQEQNLFRDWNSG